MFLSVSSFLMCAKSQSLFRSRHFTLLLQLISHISMQQFGRFLPLFTLSFKEFLALQQQREVKKDVPYLRYLKATIYKCKNYSHGELNFLQPLNVQSSLLSLYPRLRFWRFMCLRIHPQETHLCSWLCLGESNTQQEHLNLQAKEFLVLYFLENGLEPPQKSGK